MSKNVVILGAGYAGVAAAKKLNKLSKKEPEVTITLIDKNPFHTLLTELHEVAGNRIEEEDVQVNLKSIFKSTRVNVVKDVINEVDPESKVLKSEEYEYNYDYLILGTGSEPTDCGVEGVSENTFTLWSIEDAKKINEHIIDMFQKARVEDDPQERKKLLTFTVCGGGFTGVEMVGELIEWMDDLCEQYEIPRDEINLHLCEGLDNILPNLDENLANKALAYLDKKGVEVKLGSFVNKVEKDKLLFGDGEEIATGTVVWNCGVVASDFAAKLGLKTGGADRVEVNKYLQTLDYSEIYAIGDNAAAPGDDGKVLPALVEAALQTGECAAENVVADIKGTPKEEIEPKFHGIMVSIGGKYAVADLMGISIKGWPAMFMKHVVNMHYLFDLGGLKEGIGLIKDYIDEQASGRGFVGNLFNQFKQKTRTFWLVLLRIFVGVMWLDEAYDKSTGDNSWLVSGATPEVPLGPDALGFVTQIMDYVNQYPQLVNLMKWAIIFTEYALGISLILGLFSFLGALVSVVMSFNLFLAGFAGPLNSVKEMLMGEDVAQPEIKWYLFSSIALLGNSGRVFGLDYYVLPWFKRLIWGKKKGKNEDLNKVVSKK